jgi:hypothetical protein
MRTLQLCSVVHYRMKKITTNSLPRNDEEINLKFCLNCDDMDDLAVSSEAADLEQLHQRFDNCVNTGRFDGDFCSRLFVAEDAIETTDLFEDETEGE